MTRSRLRILLADDHVLFRRGIAALIGLRPELELVGEAADGLEAVEMVRQRHPDVVLLDLHMPRCNGLQAIAPLKAAQPGIRIVMLTVSADDADVFSAIKFGADGYLLKDMEPEQLFGLLEGLVRGEAPLAPALAGKILAELRSLQQNSPPRDTGTDTLTQRETEVLRLVALGATNKEISGVLSISENTVKIHVRNILEKLHLQNRTQAGAYAISHGLSAEHDDNKG